MLLVQRFDVPTGEEAAFLVRARRAVALLGAQPGCEAVELGRATEQATERPDEWVLVAVFASVAAYRRALGPFDVREHVVPFLSEARVDAPATFERRLRATPDGVDERTGILS